MKQKRTLIRAGCGIAAAVVLMFMGLPGVARADVVAPTQTSAATTLPTAATTVPTSPPSPATATSPAAVTSTTAGAASGGVTPGMVALICVIAVVVVLLGSFFIWRAQTGRRAKGGS